MGGLALAEVAANVARPWPLKLLVDNVLARRPLPDAATWLAALPGAASPMGLVFWLALLTIVVFVVGQVATGVKAYVQAGVGSRMTYDLAADLFSHLQHLSLATSGRRSVGDATRTVTSDSSCCKDLVVGVVLPAITSLVTLASMFIVLWQLDAGLSVIALLVGLPLLLIMRRFAQPLIERSLAHANLQGELMARAEQTLTALPDVQAYTQEPREDERFGLLAERTVAASLRAVASQVRFQLSTATVTGIGTTAVFLVGGLHVVDGTLTVGGIVVFLTYLASLYAPMETLVHLTGNFATAAASADRVLAVLDAQVSVRDPVRPVSLPVVAGLRGRVALEEVTFAYRPGWPVLREVSLEAAPGETVALVGRTGAGKTTLVSLVPRFFDPSVGRVTLDGRDVRALRVADVRGQVAVVRQEPLLLPVSVADNIAYGRPGATRGQVEAAAVGARADGFIRALPQGYDTVLGERGATLSGGQRQRLAIARALLKDAPVVVLDEPTSALDAETEAALVEALERLLAGRTALLIAHRLSTVRRADRIVVLDQGRIAETGTHDQLVTAGGLYQHFHTLQTDRVPGQETTVR